MNVIKAAFINLQTFGRNEKTLILDDLTIIRDAQGRTAKYFHSIQHETFVVSSKDPLELLDLMKSKNFIPLYKVAPNFYKCITNNPSALDNVKLKTK